MVVADVRVRSPAHVVEFLVALQLRKNCLRMLLLDTGDIVQVAEEEVMNLVGHVEGFYDVLNSQSGVDVLVGVAADVEVPRHFLYCEIPSQPAAVSSFKSLLRSLVLLFLVGLVEELEVFAVVDFFPIAIEAILPD